MRRREWLVALAVAATAFNCDQCVTETPGEEGEECTFDDDCREGLRCVLDKCAAVTADAGNSDAAVHDGQGADSASRDSTGRDQVGIDLRSSDRPYRDHYGQDWQPTDRSHRDHYGQDWRPPRDGGGIPDRVGFDFGGWDHPPIPDGWIPDWTGYDWASFDINIFTDGGGVRFDASIVGYDGGSEPGVICGSLVCNGGQRCCVAVGAPPVFTCAAQCDMYAVANLQCDDPGDCVGGECCATLTTTTCAPANQCLLTADGGSTNGALVCAVAADCAIHSMSYCCTSANFAGLGLDLGWCQTGPCE